MRSLPLLASALFFTTAINYGGQAASPSMQQMRKVYDNLNEICRGGSGDHAETIQACDVREEVSRLIEQMKGKRS